MEEVVAIADAGTFAGAARILQVSTSHISKAVARLERRLQTQLFKRTTRSVVMTDTGRAFVEQSRRIIQERDELMLMVDGSAEPHGELRVTCSIALGERFVAPLVRRYSEDHPRLSITLDLTNRLAELVGEGYDLAIRTGEISDPRLLGRQVAIRSIETCAAPAYLGRRGTPVVVGDLAKHSCLIGTTATWHFRENDAPKSFSPVARWRCNSGAAVADAALAEMGICQLPSFYVQEAIAAGRLTPVLTEYRASGEPIWAIYPARRHLTPKVRNLVNLIESALQGKFDQGPTR